MQLLTLNSADSVPLTNLDWAEIILVPAALAFGLGGIAFYVIRHLRQNQQQPQYVLNNTEVTPPPSKLHEPASLIETTLRIEEEYDDGLDDDFDEDDYPEEDEEFDEDAYRRSLEDEEDARAEIEHGRRYGMYNN